MPNFLTPTTHVHFESTDSTNTQLIHAVESGVLSHRIHHLYTADHQTAGRGQHGRKWVSGTDNVFLSLYIPIGQGEFELHALSGLLSLAVGYHLTHLNIIKTINESRHQHRLPIIAVKWANDIGFYDDVTAMFKKLAGILIEPVFKKTEPRLSKNTLVGVVIGVGLNVNDTPLIKDGLYCAISLKELITQTTATIMTASELYTPMANQILRAVQSCNQSQEPIYLQSFLDDFNAKHLLTDRYVHIFIQNNMIDIYAQGRCIGIGKQGELLLKSDDNITPIFAGMAKIIRC